MLDKPHEVNAAFVAWHGDGKNITNAQRLNLRYEVAKSMVHTEGSSLINKLETKAMAEHTTEMNEWNMILDDISLAKDVGWYVFTP